MALAAFVDQTLAPDEYEIIVVDDGSTDETPDLLREVRPPFTLRVRRVGHGGISVAKNVGTLAARAAIVLYADDDDEADRDLLAQHLHTHANHPGLNVAVLGYTTWSPELDVTLVMKYITEVGQQLFSYPSLRTSAKLDFQAFWGGRSSAKRQFLLEHGLFNPRFRFLEDIEFGYRLSRSGFSVVFNEDASSRMMRGITYEEFCERSRRRGTGLALFSCLHADAEVLSYCGIERVNDSVQGKAGLEELRLRLVELRLRVTELEHELDTGPLDAQRLDELHDLYARSFRAEEMQGIIEAQLRAPALPPCSKNLDQGATRTEQPL